MFQAFGKVAAYECIGEWLVGLKNASLLTTSNGPPQPDINFIVDLDIKSFIGHGFD